MSRDIEVGDWVEVIHKPYLWETAGTYIKGSEFKVKMVDREKSPTQPVLLQFPETLYYKNRKSREGARAEWWCSYTEIRKVNSGTKKVKRRMGKFNIGDDVIATNNSGGTFRGEVDQGRDTDGDYRVRVEGHGYGYFSESNLKHASYEKAYEKACTKTEQRATSQSKEKVMAKAKDVATAVVDKNKEAATLAAEVVAGQTVNQKIKDTMAPLIGEKGKELMDGPFGNLLVANLVSTAVEIYPNDERLNRASECLLKAAYIDGASDLKVKDKLLGFLDGINLPGLGSKETK
jgi:hypothetical protein